jgi:hypothetical protein
MTHRAATVSLPLVLGVWLATAGVAAAANVNLTLRFRDSGGTTLAVRVGVFVGTLPQRPGNLDGSVYQERGLYSYFYSGGNTTISVPTGQVIIRAGRGFEYEVLDTTITVTSARTMTFRLERIYDMKSLGWYSGDTHVHISHPPVVYNLDAGDLALIARGEELNLINSMEEESYFTGAIDPVSLPDRIVFFSKEQRNAHFSHLTLLGLKQWIVDAGCVEGDVACGRTLDALVYDQVHAQTGEVAVIAAHPFSTVDAFDIHDWPGGGMWRGMSIDLAAGKVDAIDLLDFWNAAPPAGVEAYFQALSAGFRVPPSAGTDCTLASGDSGPAGGYRIYVRPSGAFTMDNWIAGLKAGRSFVSNYPLFTHFDVEGAVSGDILPHNQATLHGTVSVECLLPISRIEIWGDTGLLNILTPPNGVTKSFSTSFDVASSGLTWIAARTTGIASGWHVMPANGLFAQTAPIYLEAGAAAHNRATQNVTYTKSDAAQYFLDRLDETVTVFDTLGFFPDSTREAFDVAVASARSFYEAIANAPTDVATPSLPSAWAVRNAWPNPFGNDVQIEYVAPENGGEHTVAVYDAAGRVVSVLFSGRRDGGAYRLEWNGRDAGGRRVASGVYFVRVHSRDATSVGRKLVVLH